MLECTENCCCAHSCTCSFCSRVFPGRRSRDPRRQGGHHRLGMDGLLVQATPSFLGCTFQGGLARAPINTTLTCKSTVQQSHHVQTICLGLLDWFSWPGGPAALV